MIGRGERKKRRSPWVLCPLVVPLCKLCVCGSCEARFFEWIGEGNIIVFGRGGVFRGEWIGQRLEGGSRV